MIDRLARLVARRHGLRVPQARAIVCQTLIEIGAEIAEERRARLPGLGQFFQPTNSQVIRFLLDDRHRTGKDAA